MPDTLTPAAQLAADARTPFPGASKAYDAARRETLEEIGVGDVDLAEDRVAADPVRGGLARGHIEVGDDDIGAFARQCGRVRGADPLRGARDDRGPAGESIHGLLLSLVGHTAVATSLVSRYSSKPATPISRPIPDCL